MAGLAYLSWPIPADLRYTDGVAALAKWQDGRCAACGCRRSPLVLDHDHGTALIRGFLCTSCNAKEGHNFSGKFDEYRVRPPAAVLGIIELHGGLRFGPLRSREDPGWTRRNDAFRWGPDPRWPPGETFEHRELVAARLSIQLFVPVKDE